MIPIKLRKLLELFRFENTLQLILNRTLFAKTPLTVYRYKGITALVDHSLGDQDGVKSCLVPGLYDPFLEIILPKLPQKPLTILDLGANTGGFPLALLAHGSQIKAGIAVELNPLTCTRLSLNLAQNRLHNIVHVLNGAACGHSGTLEVSLSAGSVSDSIVFGTAHGKKITLPAFTVDEIVTTHLPPETPIDICKIDIEGAEYDLFASPHSSSLRRCQWIIIEIHQVEGHPESAITDALTTLGFTPIPPLRPAVESNVFMFQQTRTSP